MTIPARVSPPPAPNSCRQPQGPVASLWPGGRTAPLVPAEQRESAHVCPFFPQENLEERFSLSRNSGFFR